MSGEGEGGKRVGALVPVPRLNKVKAPHFGLDNTYIQRLRSAQLAPVAPTDTHEGFVLCFSNKYATM